MVNKHSDRAHLRPSLFCDVTERRFVVVYRCFGTDRLSWNTHWSTTNNLHCLTPKKSRIPKS